MNRLLRTTRLPVFNAEGAAGAAPAPDAGAAAPAPTEGKTPSNAGQPPAQQDPAPAGNGKPAEPAGDPKPSDDGKAADPAADGHEEFTLTPPEGLEQYGEQFQAFASEMDGWLKENPNASAREALQEAATRQAKSVAEQQTKGTEAFEAQVSEWESTAKSDKEIGGEKFDENVATAVKALDQFGTPELRQVLQASGLGSHPEMIRFAMKAGKALEEPGVVTGQTSAQPRNFAKSIYPDKG